MKRPTKRMRVSLQDVAVELASRGLLAAEAGDVADVAITDVHSAVAASA